MLDKKHYQERGLADLEEYLQLASKDGAKRAFINLTERPYRTVRQLCAHERDQGPPYVCLRVPTGGGKTFMACHALGVAAGQYVHRDRVTCLWLVPSNTIRTQTLKALRDRKHPYREALDSWFAGHVSVMDISEALSVTRSDLRGDTCIIVSTFQALRVDDTDGRKVYEQNGALMPHFTGLPPEIEAKLDRREDGEVVYSLANVLRMNRPVVVMDEAHNARTKLSFETLARVAPSCILEFTATPETTHSPESGFFASNIVSHVSAAELKQEDMVKLPIRLRSDANPKNVMKVAVECRERLERIARSEKAETGEYIRPICLVQAQSKRAGNKLTVDAVRKMLLKDFKVPEDWVAVAAYTTDEIKDHDLFSPECPVRFIITVEKLREGWDCSFAYVLCTMAETVSAKAVEQILGRILRLPQARRKRHHELNRAYAFAASPRLIETASALRDALVENGFERFEAEQNVEPAQEQQDLPLIQTTTEAVPEPPKLEALPVELRERVIYDDGSGKLTLTGSASEADEAALKKVVRMKAAKAAVERLCERSRDEGGPKRSPAEKGEPFEVPVLAVRVGEQLELFGEEHFLDQPWDLAGWDAALSEAEYAPKLITPKSATVDVTENGRAVYFEEDLHEQVMMLDLERDWDTVDLVRFLDGQILHRDITPAEMHLFLRNLLVHLTDERGIAVADLARDRHRLKSTVRERIDAHRRRARDEAYQAVLFEGGKKVEVGPDCCFPFPDESRYAPNWYYEQEGYVFQKHYYVAVGELANEGEEFECARFIDRMPEVRYWVRNLAGKGREATSFWLQTSTDRFYPDFVALLSDGRILVVEYKGEHLWKGAEEDRDLGRLWAERSGGQCLFVMPKGKDWAAITALQ